MINDNNVNRRRQLEEERAMLEDELKNIARKNPKNSADWQAKPDDTSEIEFREDVAERLEELEDREATTVPLEQRLNEVNHALDRLNQDAYGTCLICGEKIEDDRLNANPAATTCKAHLGK